MTFSVILVLLYGLISSRFVASQEPSIAFPDNLQIEGIPSIPKAIAEQVRKYTESRAAVAFDWHPTKRQMLIGTRFGNSSQVHEIKAPGAARTQLTFFEEPVAFASYDPKDAKFFVFSKDVGGNEFSQLFRYNFSDGAVSLLTDGGRSQNGGLVWNRQKTAAAYASTQRNKVDRDIWVIEPASSNSNANRLVVENSGGGWSVTDWSSDGKSLILMEYLSINRSNLYLADVATGVKKPITNLDEEVSYSSATFSEDGSHLWITTDKGSEFQQFASLRLSDGEIVPISQSIPWDIEGIAVAPNGKTIVLVANEAGSSVLYKYDVATKSLKRIDNIPSGVVALGQWRSDSSEIAFTLNSYNSTSDVYSWEVADGITSRWTESELGGVLASDLQEPTKISWKSFDGTQITGFYFKPKATFTGARPVIINIHGGPEGQSRPLFQGRNNYFLNELGVAIIYPNVRGSAGFGKSYLKMDNGLKRFDSVKDIGALIDWIGTQANLDVNRIMVTGGSYGGYMTLATAVEYNDKIRCSLDVVGISHFGTFLKNTESYRRDLRRVEYGDERLPEMIEFFDRIAPLNQSHKIKKPLFVVQGGNDPRVPMSEAEQMVAQVKSNGSPIWYMMAKDEGHGFRKKSNADLQFYATVQFVKDFLINQ
ncbi:MAG: prolyl oligopeptidase family serine peptidase [Planctomycetota bacterium]|nr:prolyl oligopeptidase family serine peptidase [Planctomycetota bacterium]